MNEAEDRLRRNPETMKLLAQAEEELGTGGRADLRDLPEWLDLVHDYVWTGEDDDS